MYISVLDMCESRWAATLISGRGSAISAVKTHTYPAGPRSTFNLSCQESSQQPGQSRELAFQPFGEPTARDRPPARRRSRARARRGSVTFPFFGCPENGNVTEVGPDV